jgi:predicted dehydrogenase
MASIRLAILGGGIMGRQIAEAALRTGRFEIAAVAEPDSERAAAFVRHLGGQAFADVPTLFDQAQVDAAYVALPHDLHLPACAAAAAAGVHVLIDKPLCNTIEEANRISELAAESGRIWMMGLSYRFRAEWRRAAEIVRSGELGEVYFVSDVIVESARAMPAWYWRAASGGGVIQLQSHHCFDRIGWLLDSEPQKVACSVVRLPSEETERAAQFAVTYANGAVAEVGLSFGMRYGPWGKALFLMQGVDGVLQIDAQQRALTVAGPSGVRTEHHSEDDWMAREASDFADAIEGKGPASPGVAEGVAALRGALAARAAADSQAWVTVR